MSRRSHVTALLARVRARGGRMVRPAAAASWGGEAGVFADPDGHLWEVAWNPRFRLAGSGRRRGSPRPARRPR
ncbi:MAG TPA: VOC family protein [Candidatus Polarisedimenticolia bacterium]|nr:VOC family protein [Candidatus Polarisedimenticolia bacterium]